MPLISNFYGLGLEAIFIAGIFLIISVFFESSLQKNGIMAYWQPMC